MSERDVFCKIVDGELPSEKVWEDEKALVFKDINPAAPVHLLVIPKKHITSLDEMEEGDKELMGHLLWVAKEVAKKEGLAGGYRLVINTHEKGGQTVFHLHIHILGGRRMSWPPG